MRGFDGNTLNILSKMVKQAGQALSDDQKRLYEAVKNIVQREIWVTEKVTLPDGKVVKRRYKRLNDLDNILPYVYEIGMRGTGLKDVPAQVFSNMVTVQGYLRKIYSLRAKIEAYQRVLKETEKDLKEARDSKDAKSPKPDPLRRQVELYLSEVTRGLGINLKTVKPASLWNNEEETFLNFMNIAVQLVLLHIIPNISRDIRVPIVFGDDPSEPDLLKSGNQSKNATEKFD